MFKKIFGIVFVMFMVLAAVGFVQNLPLHNAVAAQGAAVAAPAPSPQGVHDAG